MSINYPISIPTGINPSSYTLGYMTNTRVNTSPFTFSTQRIESYGQAWTLKMDFPPLTEEQARLMASFMAKLKGAYGSFYFSPKNPWKGTGSGAPTLVSIDNDLRTTITISPSNTSFPEGSLVQIGEQLVQIQTSVPAKSGNVANVSVFPRLRSAIPAGKAIIYTNPKGKFALTANEQQWTIDRSRHYAFSLEAIESL
jgi:hypothetical protein